MAAQAGLSLTWSKIQNVGFFVTKLILSLQLLYHIIRALNFLGMEYQKKRYGVYLMVIGR